MLRGGATWRPMWESTLQRLKSYLVVFGDLDFVFLGKQETQRAVMEL